MLHVAAQVKLYNVLILSLQREITPIEKFNKYTGFSKNIFTYYLKYPYIFYDYNNLDFFTLIKSKNNIFLVGMQEHEN